MKKILALLLALTMALALAACGTTPKTDETNNGEAVTLRVGASPTPHAEILKQVVEPLKEQGITLEIVEYGDYVVPNTAVEEGEDDANYFQHTPYMESHNAKNGTHLVAVAELHYEPMGIYAGKCDSLEALPDGATIAIPNDPTNEGRALLLLESQGLITLKDSTNLESTPNDIADNPKNLKFSEMEAAMLPQTVEDVDLSVINSNYALEGGFDPTKDALAIETSDTTPYPNVLCVKEGNENNEAIQALIKALKTDEVRSFIEETYKGAVVPLF